MRGICCTSSCNRLGGRCRLLPSRTCQGTRSEINTATFKGIDKIKLFLKFSNLVCGDGSLCLRCCVVLGPLHLQERRVDPQTGAVALLCHGLRVAVHGEGRVECVVPVPVVRARHPDGAEREVVGAGGEVEGLAAQVLGRGPPGGAVAEGTWEYKYVL